MVIIAYFISKINTVFEVIYKKCLFTTGVYLVSKKYTF